MKLYYVPKTRANRPRWLLEELQVPYELVRVDPKNKPPELLAVSPLGHVPALVDGELTMIESAAICLYLADKFLDRRLAPSPNSAERGVYFQWVLYAMAEIEPAIVKFQDYAVKTPEGERDPSRIAEARQAFGRVAEPIANALSGREHLLRQFSAADVVLGSALIWARGVGLLEGHAALDAYAQRLLERPATQKARGD